MFAIIGKLGSRGPIATLSLAFKLLPGRLPAGTPKFEFQRTERLITLMGQMGPQFNRGRGASDAKFISIQARAMDGVFFRGFDKYKEK
jgi:hypothetical protein